MIRYRGRGGAHGPNPAWAVLMGLVIGAVIVLADWVLR
jgi:hypothetical protein